jgi:hypothetical protein
LGGCKTGLEAMSSSRCSKVDAVPRMAGTHSCPSSDAATKYQVSTDVLVNERRQMARVGEIFSRVTDAKRAPHAKRPKTKGFSKVEFLDFTQKETE